MYIFLCRIGENEKLAVPKLNCYISPTNAGIAQLVERNLAKVDVAGSNPVSRSALRGRGRSVIAPKVPENTLPLKSGPAAPNPTRWRGFVYMERISLDAFRIRPEEPGV